MHEGEADASGVPLALIDGHTHKCFLLLESEIDAAQRPINVLIAGTDQRVCRVIRVGEAQAHQVLIVEEDRHHFERDILLEIVRVVQLVFVAEFWALAPVEGHEAHAAEPLSNQEAHRLNF